MQKTLATMVPLRVQTCSVAWYSNHSYSRAEVKRDLLACQDPPEAKFLHNTDVLVLLLPHVMD